METIDASEFKAKCLAILDRLIRTGEGITILRRGRPVAQLIPVVPRDEGYPQDTLKGTIKILGDVTRPVLPSENWKVEKRRK